MKWGYFFFLEFLQISSQVVRPSLVWIDFNFSLLFKCTTQALLILRSLSICRFTDALVNGFSIEHDVRPKKKMDETLFIFTNSLFVFNQLLSESRGEEIGGKKRRMITWVIKQKEKKKNTVNSLGIQVWPWRKIPSCNIIIIIKIQKVQLNCLQTVPENSQILWILIKSNKFQCTQEIHFLSLHFCE